MSNETIYLVSCQNAKTGEVKDLFLTTGMEMADDLQVEWDNHGEETALPCLFEIEQNIETFTKAVITGNKIVITVMATTSYQKELMRRIFAPAELTFNPQGLGGMTTYVR